MPALSDRSFNPQAWRKLALVAVGLGVLVALILASRWAFEAYVETPRLLDRRFDDPPGRVGMASTMVADLKERAVPTLIADLASEQPQRRSKAVELLSSIDDPRVVPTLAKVLKDPDLGVRMAALGGLARTGKAEAAAVLWPLTESHDDFLRMRAYVALGVVGMPADADRLLTKELPQFQGQERYVVAWAAGRILRRIELNDPKRYVAAAKSPETDEDSQRIQAQVDAALAEIDAGRDLALNAKRLDELTDLGFSTWDVAHQVGAQVLAVTGPMSLRRAGGSRELGPTKLPQGKLELKRPELKGPGQL
jgi:HEAT repeat protein